ncbi:S9 family peptidase [Candidatus Zixiibacteriota bacterium]
MHNVRRLKNIAWITGLWGLLVFVFIGCAQQSRILPSPPVAARIAHVDTLHGDVRVDHYFWLREKTNPEVIAYLEAENEYTAAKMKHTEPLQQKLYDELLGRIKETDLSVPVREDDYYYYSRTEEGKQYKIYARKKGSLEAAEDILLDVNQMAVGHKFFDIGADETSPDHQSLVYSVDTAGNELFTIHVKDLRTGELYPEEIPDTYYDVAWFNDNQTFFYCTLDEAKRPYRLYRHTLGDNPVNDQLIYQEDDEMFWMEVRRTKSKAYILLSLESETTSEVWYLSADTPGGKLKVVHPREQGLEYSVNHHGNRFQIVTNDNAQNFKLVDAPVTDPGKENWREVIAHRDSVKIDRIDVFKDYLVVYEREAGLRQLSIHNVHSGETHRVEFPEPVYTVYGGDNPDFNSRLLRFVYSSLVTPESVFDYDMQTRERELKKQDEVLGGYEPSAYQSERVFATAADGTRVPISLVYRKGLVKNGANYLMLRGYGSYGSSSEPKFSSYRLSLIDRGFIYAIAHIRGGGEMGRWWYEQGKLLQKKNTFTDFIACAEHLIAEKYTTKSRLAIYGGSAGGLLIGAVVSMRPDLFQAAVADVPFVDVVNTMADPSIPLTVIEYEEWGNPADREYYEYMLSYSPYDNVEVMAYPHLLITAGLNDPRVQYWEPAKWAAKLRSLKTDDNLLILKTNMGAGHMGASGRYDYLKEYAFEYAFILDRLGLIE